MFKRSRKLHIPQLQPIINEHENGCKHVKTAADSRHTQLCYDIIQLKVSCYAFEICFCLKKKKKTHKIVWQKQFCASITEWVVGLNADWKGCCRGEQAEMEDWLAGYRRVCVDCRPLFSQLTLAYDWATW